MLYFLNILLLIILFIIGGCWRRLFGGWLSDVEIIKERFVQHLIGGIILFCILYYTGIKEWGGCLALLYAIGIQGLFWAPGHGMWFDIGRTDPNTFTEKEIERYKKSLGYKVVEFLLPKRFRYSFFYDFLGMTLRYAIPSLIFLPILPQFIWIGLAVGPIYAFCWSLFEMDGTSIELRPFINYPTALAEFICGGLVYSGLYFLIRNFY